MARLSGPDKTMRACDAARLASARLPRKVLRTIAGRPMLAWVYEAARSAFDLADGIRLWRRGSATAHADQDETNQARKGRSHSSTPLGIGFPSSTLKINERVSDTSAGTASPRNRPACANGRRRYGCG